MVMNVVSLLLSVITWTKIFRRSYFDENFSADFSLKLLYEGAYSFSVSISKAAVSTFLFLIVLLSPERYCSSDLSWRSSETCRVLGQLVMIAVPCGVFATFLLNVVIFAANRSTSLPIKSRKLRFQLLYSLVFIFAVWAPLVAMNFFATNKLDCSAWVSSDYGTTFLSKGNVVTRSEMLQIARCVGNSTETAEWKKQTEVLKGFLRDYDVTLHGTFGYFSHSGLCLPLFMAGGAQASGDGSCTGQSEATSLALVAAFTFLCFASLVTSLLNFGHQRELARRLVCFCVAESIVWLPIAIMKIAEVLQVGGTTDRSHQTVALVAVSVNSSLVSPTFVIVSSALGKIYSPVQKSEGGGNDEIALNSSASE